MKKSYNAEKISVSEVTEQDLSLINKLSRRALKSDEVYSFNLILCDNNIDRDNEMFSVNALEQLAKGFIGIGGGFNHSMDATKQHARIYHCEVITDETRKNTLGEAYTYLMAKAYIPKTEQNLPLIEEIEAGIKKEVSISCCAKSICSICHEGSSSASCNHIKGQVYNNKLCYGILDDISDCYEWSFVCVPAQPNAGVIKSFFKGERNMEEIFKQLKSCKESITLSAEEAVAISKRMQELEALASDGVAYKKALKSDIVKLCSFTLPGINAENLENICNKLNSEELKELKKGLMQKADENDMPAPQLSANVSSAKKENTQFKI
ncbi:MAG: hypothetical protein K5917_00400 [Clostridiales bacterium]|nr:hypothetical protein [Clostridiales bacterium]